MSKAPRSQNHTVKLTFSVLSTIAASFRIIVLLCGCLQMFLCMWMFCISLHSFCVFMAVFSLLLFD